MFLHLINLATHMIKIKRGLDLPITGAPEQAIYDGPTVRTVAVLGRDYVGMKPTMAIQVGDKVKKGRLLFTDKKTEGVRYTAPAAGSIAAINRGEKRALQSVVIDVEGDEAESFAQSAAADLSALKRDQVVENLVNSGLWTALRTRPFSKVPAPASQPEAIFVAAIDTNPLAADPALIIAEHSNEFTQGLEIISKLTDGEVFVAKAPGADIPTGDARVKVEEFDGPHPAGNVGTHIHFLRPASETKTVWHIGYQDVIAVAQLFTTGELNSQRVVSLAGPQVTKPRLIRTQLGANLDEMTAGQLNVGDEANRVISGSVLSGQTARGAVSYLGRYAVQVSVLSEKKKRDLLGYMSLGANKHSLLNVYLSKLNPGKKFNFTTTTNGSPRAMVPTGSYERVMPLDILATQLLRSIIVGDLESAQALGCLELDEEDLALCTYVCAGKYEYGPILRNNLTVIEKEG
ncbi:Na(+)-translocating NADH-quinone reductase subunit A [gamma proteobacterium IMCC2047]|nr:Na(+)-translocating NADH-quinone reductase subunit A [gamma proteobacterium IMCC2047]